MELRKAFLLVVFCLSFLVGLGYADAIENGLTASSSNWGACEWPMPA